MTLKTVALAFTSLALVPAAPAHAGSCHGGGGGGGSSGGSSSSGGGGGGSYGGGGGYSSGDVYASSDGGSSSTSACVDDSDVHGFRHCTKFGAWAGNMRIPRLFVELGSSMRAFQSGLGERTGTVQHGLEQFAYRVVMPTAQDASRDLAMTTTLRLGFGISRHLYSGLDGEIGGLVAPATATAEMTTTPGTYGSPDVQQGSGLVLGIAGVAGYRAVGSRGSIALEGAGGLRSVRYKFDSSYHECETSTTIVDNRAIVEARARAELWLNPWLTAGVTLGSSVLDRDDWMAGIYLGAHSRAFAGGR